MADSAQARPEIPPPSAEDLRWAEKLKRRILWTPLPARAQAKLAEALGQAIEKKRLWRLDFLLSTPLKRLGAKQPVPLGVNDAFASAWAALEGDWLATKPAADVARRDYPALYAHQRTPPLTAAVIAGFTQGAALLLAQGAAPFAPAPHVKAGFQGAIAAAIFRGNEDMMTLLMQDKAVQDELSRNPAFRNFILFTALGTDNAATLRHLATLDTDLLEKAVVYDGKKAADFTLGNGVLNRPKKPPAPPPPSKYGR